MKLALNYSPQAAELLRAGTIEIDLYKCPDWPEMIQQARQQRPVYVHFPIMAGRGNIEKVGWRQISDLLAETGTPYVNMHLAPRASDFHKMPLDTTEPAHARELVNIMLRDIIRLAARFGRDRVILENANWDPNYEIPRPVLEPEVIRQVVRDSGCGFLLDLAHARMAAAYLGVDVREYIAALPVYHLRELHITGTHFDPQQGRLVDHYPMTEDDWALAGWALNKIHDNRWQTPDIVALEYGGVGPGFGWRSHSEVIAVEAPRLLALMQPPPADQAEAPSLPSSITPSDA